MNLLDRLLAHDAWTTRQLLEICAILSDEQIDHEFDIGHRTLRATLDHIIANMEAWSSLMMCQDYQPDNDRTVPGMLRRLSDAESVFKRIAKKIDDADAWNDRWMDTLDDPPQQKSFGSAIAHVITHSMHHRAQVLSMLRYSGVKSLPEGDVFSWERGNGQSNS